MEKFQTFSGKFSYMPISNIDTDMIIPKQYLKTLTRSGLGQYAFAEMRYTQDNEMISDFVLNQHPDTKILIAGDNFGCGSSREHAPWALMDFGLKAVISTSFADIFYNNCFKNGLLPIVMQQSQIDNLIQQNTDLTIDLENQKVFNDQVSETFDIDGHRKEILLKGLDDIESVLQYNDEIEQFKRQYFLDNPWMKENINV